MKKCVKLLAFLFVAAVFFQSLCMPAFAITESEVEAQVASSGKAAVTGNVLIWFLCAVAFLKVSQKIDSFMASLGVNVGRTGGSLLSEAMIAMRALTMVVGGKGGGAGGVKASAGSGGGRAASTGMTGFFKGGLIGMAGRHITNSAVKTATAQTSAIHTARSQAEQAAGTAGTDGGSHGNAAGDEAILDPVPGESPDTVSGTMTGISPDAAAVGTVPDPVPGEASGYAAQNDAASSDEEVFSQGSPVKTAVHGGAISLGEPPQEGVILTGAEMPMAAYEADPSPEVESGPKDSLPSDGTPVQTENTDVSGKKDKENGTYTELYRILRLAAPADAKVFKQIPNPKEKDKSDSQGHEHLIHGLRRREVSQEHTHITAKRVQN